MTLTTKRKDLEKYRNYLDRIAKLKEKREILSIAIENVKTKNITDMPKGGKPIDVEQLIDEKELLTNRIERLEEHAKIVRGETLMMIDLINDERYYNILRKYYVEVVSLSDIAEQTNYTERYCRKLLVEGVKLV